MHKKLVPHRGDAKVLAASAQVYARGKTPEITPKGTVAELNVKPAGPDLAARHVREIHRASGEEGLRQTIHGLQITRGNQFVLQMLNHDRGVKDILSRSSNARPALPGAVQTVLGSNETGRPLPLEQRNKFAQATGRDASAVRLFDNHRAHDAAAALNARAFTLGQRIFFNRGEFDPGSKSGSELLMHELVHTVQQKDAPISTGQNLEISRPGDEGERQAESVARAVSRNQGRAAANDGPETREQKAGRDVLGTVSSGAARIQRAITFTTADNAPTTNDVVAEETAAGFQLRSPDPTFQWQPDVTIHGNAGDDFADWETAHHQVAKGFWENVYWGVGIMGNQTHRHANITGGLPMRDATDAANTWYSDWRAQTFAADGDVRSPVMHDRPQTEVIPWDNPIAGRLGNSGWFNYGFGFVSTLSARHVPDGTGAAAFRHLNHRHWNFMIDGEFDGALALGGRVRTTGGAVNHSRMFSGIDASNPPMHGGPIVNDNFNTVDR
jgi:hypothetical protein